MESKAFDAKNYPYTTTDPELLEAIKKNLDNEATPLAERVAKLPPQAKGTTLHNSQSTTTRPWESTKSFLISKRMLNGANTAKTLTPPATQ